MVFKHSAKFCLLVALMFFASSFCVSALTIISACNTTLNISDTYQLNQSINAGVFPVNCLNITASNVTLDCMGFNIVGVPFVGNGILATSVRNVTVRNCNISNFGISISLLNVNDSSIHDNNMSASFSSGIRGLTVRNSSFVNNIVDNVAGWPILNAYGMFFNNSNNNTIRLNIIRNNDGGITINNSNTFVISSNIITNNSVVGAGIGIFALNGVNYTVSNNNLTLNRNGIVLWNINNSVITGNNISNSSLFYGIILMLGSSNNNVSGGVLYNNWMCVGIGLGGNCNNNNVVNVTCYTSNSSATIASSTGNTIVGMKMFRNLDGIRIVNVTNTTISGCTFTNSTMRDFYINSTGVSFLNNVLNYTYRTTISFTEYSGAFNISGLDFVNSTAPLAPLVNISKFVNVTNLTANAWIVLNISYTNAEIAGIAESSLRMYHYNGSAWMIVATSAVVAAKNVVTANLSDFSPFGLLGNVRQAVVRPRGGGGRGTSFYQVALPPPKEEEQAPPQMPPDNYQRSYQSDKSADEAINTYSGIDDMVTAHSGVGGGEVSRGLSTSSLVALVVAIIAIGLFAAYIVSPKKKSRK